MFRALLNRFIRKAPQGNADPDALDLVVRDLASRGWTGTAQGMLDEIHKLPEGRRKFVPGSASASSATLRWRAKMQNHWPGVEIEFHGPVGHRRVRLISLKTK